MDWCWTAVTVSIARRFPPGRIVSQVPMPGEMVRRGWHVRVAESMGPQRVTIPDLTGDSERSAEINIRRRGLEMGSMAVAEIAGATPDQVVAQTPPANATNVSTPKVSVLIAATEDRKSYVMPDLRGRTEDEAISVIVGAGMKVGSISSQPAARRGCRCTGDDARRVAHCGEDGSGRGAAGVGRTGCESGSDEVNRC